MSGEAGLKAVMNQVFTMRLEGLETERRLRAFRLEMARRADGHETIKPAP